MTTTEDTLRGFALEVLRMLDLYTAAHEQQLRHVVPMLKHQIERVRLSAVVHSLPVIPAPPEGNE